MRFKKIFRDWLLPAMLFPMFAIPVLAMSGFFLLIAMLFGG